MEFFNAFWVGGLICLLGQLLIDLTKLTPARIMVIYVLGGMILGAFGIYDNIVNFAGSGASVPLSGFGNLIAVGVRSAVAEKGVIGIFTGGLTSGAAGIGAAVAFGFLFALISKPSEK